MDERDAELCAHQGELLGAVVGAVVDEQSHGEPPACDGLLEHGEERGGVLRVGEGGEGEDAGGVVDERDEEGLSAPASVAHLRPVHHVAHPQFAGVAVGEASPVGGDGVTGAFVEHSLAREQPVHGRGGKRVLDAALAGGADERFDRECGLLGLDRDEQLGELWGQSPGLAAVGAGLRIQRLEPAVAIEAEPVAHGLDGDTGAPGGGDGVGALCLLVQGTADVSAAWGQAEHVGDEAVAEMLPATFPLICCGANYVAVIQILVAEQGQSLHLRNIILYVHNDFRKTVSSFFSFHGRFGRVAEGIALALPCHEIFVWTMDFPRGMLVPCHSPRSAAHCGTRRRLRV